MTGSYAYEAVDLRGKRLRGTADAASPAALARSLEEGGLLVLKVADAGTADRSVRPGRGRRRAVLEVTRALASLLPAGMPLPRALGAAEHVAGAEVAAALRTVRTEVERGEAVADALARHPALFSPVYVGVVRAGERSGELAGSFERLSAQLEREEEIRARLLSASIYPLVLAVAGGLALLVLLFFVLPRFVDLLSGTGVPLPRSTALLLSTSTALRRFWPVMLGVAVLGGLYLSAFQVTERGRRATSVLLLRLPLVGGFRRLVLGARFARLTGVLLAGGAPLLSALEDYQRSLDDPLARDEVGRIRARVREGGSLHQAIGEDGLFPPLVSQLVAVGEKAGRVEEFLLKVAEILERKGERTVQRLVALVEPGMIIVFGALVGFVALSLLQAVYGINADAFR